MHNRKAIAVSLMVSMTISACFILTGINTLIKYWGHKNDWHFAAAFIGTAGFIFLLIVSLIALLKSDKWKASPYQNKSFH